MYLGSGSPSLKLPAPTARSSCMTEGCGGRRRRLFRGKEVVVFGESSEGFWGILICSRDEESGFWGRVELATMGLVMEW